MFLWADDDGGRAIRAQQQRQHTQLCQSSESAGGVHDVKGDAGVSEYYFTEYVNVIQYFISLAHKPVPAQTVPDAAAADRSSIYERLYSGVQKITRTLGTG